MFIPFPAMLISIAPIINVVDPVPKFDLRSICEGNEACVRGETAARNQLAEQWSQFPAAERARCVRLTTSSKMPSYVQVITLYRDGSLCSTILGRASHQHTGEDEIKEPLSG